MPFYEYECSSCKFYTEVMQKITDAPLTKCPSCGKKALKKLVSAPIFRLKGAGWYETDFKGDQENKRNLVGAEKDEAAKPEAASEAKSEPPKGEKSEPSKAEPGTGDLPSKKPASKPDSIARPADSKSRPAKRSGGGRVAKPASRVAAAKARPVAATRSKAKPTTRKKKARR